MKKFFGYSGLVLLLVPVQTTLLPHVAIWDIKPDLGLVLAALIGVLAGELEGLMVGLAIGWILNLYSAGDLWLNLVTTGGAGLFAGLLADRSPKSPRRFLPSGCSCCRWPVVWWRC